MKTPRKYADLQPGNEFDFYCGGRSYRRCRILKIRRDGDRIRLNLQPVSSTRSSFWQEFLGTAQTEIYTQDYATERALLFCDRALECFTLGEPSWTAHGIRGIYREKFGMPPKCLPKTCELLAEQGKLIQRFKGKKATPVYRLPLSIAIGLPVVELPGTRSEKLGWIVGSQLIRGNLAPVVHYLNGVESVASEQWIEPVARSDRFRWDRIEAVKALISGSKRPPVEIPYTLLTGMATRITNDLLLEIAELLELPNFDRNQLRPWAFRNQILNYLDTYYPTWRSIRGVA